MTGRCRAGSSSRLRSGKRSFLHPPKSGVSSLNQADFIKPFSERILIVTGHYGSGKTEFSVSLTLLLAGCQERAYPRLALVDLDIVNPYFRSREQTDLLERAGVKVYGGLYGKGTAAEIPELAANIRAPLEDKGCRVILDAGGNDSGAKVLNQFKKYFLPEETAMLAVLNFNRFETLDAAGAAEHVRAIERVTGLAVRGIVNNTHLLRETTADTIRRGHELCAAFCAQTGKALWCDCYPEQIVSREALAGVSDTLMPLGLYMRPTWLDR